MIFSAEDDNGTRHANVCVVVGSWEGGIKMEYGKRDCIKGGLRGFGRICGSEYFNRQSCKETKPYKAFLSTRLLWRGGVCASETVCGSGLVGGRVWM